MNKLMMAAGMAVVAGTVFAAAPASKETVDNGHFAVAAPVGKNTSAIGEKWVKSWRLAGSAEVKGGKLQLHSGCIYQLLQLPGDNSAYVLKGSIKAAAVPGKAGRLNARLSTCVRKNPNMPFSHSLSRKFTTVVLSPEAKVYSFEWRVDPFEVDYLYVGESDAEIESVSLIATPVLK